MCPTRARPTTKRPNTERNYYHVTAGLLPDADVAPLFGALSDATRRQVVQLLGAGPQRAGQLAAATGTSAPAMSRHLRVLLRAGIVTDERTSRDARARVFRMVALQAWLDQLQAHWAAQLQSFKRHVEERPAP